MALRQLSRKVSQLSVSRCPVALMSSNVVRLSVLTNDSIRYFSNAADDDNIFRSNAEMLIAQVPVVEVDGDVARCDGGGGALGHPVEFIQLNDIDPDVPKICKYCGVRFIRKQHH